VGYRNAGTVEFIADASQFYFIEMNTRLQVEHPVSEMILGLDLVELQLRVAAGEKLPFSQEEVEPKGHAIEARVYAEDPEHGFLPSTGKLLAAGWPSGQGIRIDTGVEAGSEVTPFYDPMIAKVIVHAATREAALDNLAGALERTVLAGPRNNLPFLAALCRSKGFRAGKLDTGYIGRNLGALGAEPRAPDLAAAAWGAVRLLGRGNMRAAAAPRAANDVPSSPWDAGDGFQLSGVRAVPLPLIVDGAPTTGVATWSGDGVAVTIDGVAAAPDGVAVDAGQAVHVVRAGRQTVVRLRDFAAIDVEHLDSGGTVASPMHGKVLAVLVDAGAKVVRGQRVALIEAMKMEHTLTAPTDGTVAEILARAGDQVAEGATLLRIEADAPASV
jgi:3-methylcrotonyl-CoA carboxylase alpha subunit